jgi:two-component system, sensor histidine kinase and response regulator
MSQTKKILIIGNGTKSAKLAGEYLALPGFDVTSVPECHDAMEKLGEQRYDAVLLGTPPNAECMPRLRQLQEAGDDPAIIAIIDVNEEGRFIACLKEGAVDCIMAPFTQEELLKRIERGLALKALDREKRDFVSMLSHDLKNPITAVIGSVDLVREGRLGPINNEQAEYLQSAIDSCIEVVAMIENLLDIHRFEAGKMQIKQNPANLAEIVKQVCTSFKGVAQHARIRLTTNIDDTMPPMPLDRGKFSRVLANLLSNAVKFTPEGGEITVNCSMGIAENSDLAVILSVKDTGDGIPAEDLPLIFDRFVQARNRGSRGGGGSGLGLAFCKMTVEAHSGTISAASREGHGSEFTITLPAPEEQPERIEAA